MTYHGESRLTYGGSREIDHYIGGSKPNWLRSDVISQNVQVRVSLPFFTCDVVLPTTVADLPVGGMVPPEGVRSGPVCAPPPAFQCTTT